MVPHVHLVGRVFAQRNRRRLMWSREPTKPQAMSFGTFVSQRNRELSWNQMQLSHRIFNTSCPCNGHLVYTNDYLIIWGVPNFITPTWRWFVDQIWFNVCVYWCIYISGWWFQTFVIFHTIWDNPSHWLICFQRGWNHQPAYNHWQI